MSIKLPLFPLNIVVFPDEELNLHIFEPRYKQLIRDCIESDSTFGVPSFVNKKIEFGTEVKIIKVVKTYDDGRMDIITKGMSIIKILKFTNPLKGKLYAGGEVTQIENIDDGTAASKKELIKLVKELFSKINLSKEVKIQRDFTAFEIAHKIGLSPTQEYKLLMLNKESERQLYIIEHLRKAIPILEQINSTKERIKMNGHFRHFDPLNF
ncbi:LON peptidase substrate-binding domain-containing protein [Fulvivirgaceae bacterium BMA10]|uniref:LON peptidase substrate-binding domain-containing protein n=1 Tax=Splendidivirga corallicola TaxID=3051826 RepID=A0ABT8KKX8_9BACT|nr:LON peptidase substrate-binding domain-containing protein [Fulvivirgaceae bacterium BMA10]